MDNKRKLLVLSLICVIFFSVAPLLAIAEADEGSGNSTNDNSTINNTVVPPTVDFTADVTDGNAPLNVSFTSTCTGNPTEFYWIFGDGTYSNQESAATHTYMQPGKYDVLLTVTNAAGSNTETKLSYITVNDSNIPDVVPTTPCANSSDDNNTNNCNNTDKTDNCTNSTKLNSTCNASSVPANLKVLCHGKAPRRVHFIDRSKNHVSTYWNFGDGKASKCKSVTHIYKKPGKYPVKFTIKYRSGRIKTIKAGYIVVTGSCLEPATNNTTNSAQQNSTNTSSLTPTPTPTPTPTENSSSVYISALYVGTSNQTENQEYVQITNSGTTAVDLSGWKITDEGANYVYTFSSYTLPSESMVTLNSGLGTDTTSTLYWNIDHFVWNNDGDTAYLYDAQGKLVSSKSG